MGLRRYVSLLRLLSAVPVLVGRSKKPISRREAQILELAFLGYSNGEIDAILGLYPTSANSTLSFIAKKWGVERSDVLKEAVRLGYF